jgi:hypothetical protein
VGEHVLVTLGHAVGPVGVHAEEVASAIEGPGVADVAWAARPVVRGVLVS